MKLVTDQNMRTIGSIVASSQATGFPATNLLAYDPDLIWMAAAFSGTVTLVIDLLVSSAVDHIWLNNANFYSAVIQANSADSWASPPVSVNVALAPDDVGVIKGFFDLTATHYRYVRVSIPVQTLANNDAAPFLGNIIIGTSEALLVSDWQPDGQEDFGSFSPDAGGYTEFSQAKPRHIFSAKMLNVTKAEADAAPLHGWEKAVVFTDLGSVADSFLVFRPKGKRLQVRSQIDCDLDFVLRELV